MNRLRSRKTSLLALSMVLLLTAGQYASAEIPHENFDLVSTDMDLVIQLLTQGLNATELALVSCLDGRPANASRNLTLLDSILDPVTELISQIEDLATSYDNLHYLTPPFENLSLGGHRFIANQTIYLEKFEALKSYLGRTLFAYEGVEARELISVARATAFYMNSNLDTMDNATSVISDLVVENSKAFDTTYLEELIDRLRMLLDEYQSQLVTSFFIMEWGEPFVLLIADKTEYHLGEMVKISGYLYNGPTPLKGKGVDIFKDGVWFETLTTNDNGTFETYWNIPVDKKELGHHNLTAKTVVEGYFLEDNREIIVLKIPTDLTLWINGLRFSPDETVEVTSLLEDYKLRPLDDKTVEYQLDKQFVNLTTSAAGQSGLTLNASDLDWGRHFLTVRFNGTEIYDPAENETQFFDVNYNTTLSLELSANRVKQGENVTIAATLYVNVTRTLPYHTVTIKMDDVVIATGTTNANGDFIYGLDTKKVPAGTHIIRAWFYSTEPKYQDAVSEVRVLIVYVPSSGENEEGVGDWWTKFTDNIYWVLILIAIIIILAVLMLSKETIDNVRPPGGRKGAGLKGPAVTVDSMPAASEALPPPGSQVSSGEPESDFSAMPPREAIVRRYGVLLEALRIWRRIPIQANMTAREIGELLRRIGYPAEETAQVTMIFEKAMYSAKEMTSADWERFSGHADSLQYFGGAAK